MADTTSYENKYRGYLEDDADTFLKPQLSTGEKLLSAGVAAVGLAAGGVLAYKSGLLRPMIESAIQKAGQYRKGRISGAATAVRRWSEEEALAGNHIVGGVKDVFKGNGTAKLKETADAIKRFGEYQQSGEVEHIQRMATIGQSQLRDTHVDAARRFSDRENRLGELRDLQTKGHVIQEDVDAAERLMDDNILNAARVDAKEQELKMLQTGHRFATVEDLINAKEVNMNDPDGGAWIRHGMDVFARAGRDPHEFLQTKADDFVLINKDNKLADLRDYRDTFKSSVFSITTDFTIPLIKINPLRMFYLDQVFSPATKPFFHVAMPETRNPLVTGAGNAAIGRPLLFVEGTVHDITRRDAKGVIPILDDNMYLVDGKAGPVARMLRNMSAVSVSKFDEPKPTDPLLDRVKYRFNRIFDIGLQDEPLGQMDGFDMTSWGAAVINKFTRPLQQTKYQHRGILQESFGKDADFIYMRGVKNPTQAGGWKNFLTQFTAGRENLDQVTTGSLYFYGFMERLNATLNQVGMGLSNKNLGSGFDIFASLMAYRIAPVWAGAELWDYANYESEELLGMQMSDKFAMMYADTSIELAGMRDRFGITDWAKRASTLLVGGEQLADFPIVGGLMDWDDTKEETQEYWESGEDPVRRGRWWQLGNTPYTGAKIDRFEPNWVRRVLSDYEYTDTLYGSREEYFQNTWMPTLRHPLAPIRHFVTDPYHYEEKHYQDRPYPVTGGIPELENFPLVGPVLNATVGRILKPERMMHEGEWASTKFTNVREGTLMGVPAEAMPATIGTSYGDGVIAASPPVSMQKDVANALALYVTSSGDIQVLNTDNRSNIFQAQKNMSDRSPARSGKFRMERMARESTVASGPQEVGITAMDASQALSNLHYNTSEMAGFYGFLGVSMTGEMNLERPVLQSSSDMTSYSRAFWDMDIGGYGGDTNEIFRRFLPKDRKLNEVNAIPNTMPDWLPGSSYFINFQQGDPYVKVKKGEMRLPGESYERLYGIDSTKLDKMEIGASSIGYEPTTIRDHMLKRDVVKDEYLQVILDKGTDWHKKWEKEMAARGVAVSMEQYVKDEESGISGFYDLLGHHDKVLGWLTENAVEFKYYKAADGTGTAEDQGGFYDKPIDVMGMDEENRKKFFSEILAKSKFALIDPKTRGDRGWNQDEMHFENVQQVNFYANQMNTDVNYLIHVNRDNPDAGIKVFGFEKNPLLLKYTESKVNYVRNGIRNEIADGSLHRGDLYNPIDRYRILADVAPYSQEFRTMKDQLSQMNFKESEKKEIKIINDQVSARKENVRMYPYRFKTANVENDRVTITGIIDNNTFLTKEFPDNPIRLAGLRASVAKDNPMADAVAKELSRTVKVGDKVKIAYDADESNRVKDDTYNTIQAVLYDKHGRNVNKYLIDKGIVKEKGNDFSPAAVHARFTPREISLGATWEKFAHADTILHTKFLQVRSPLESYERREVYGKDWQDWTDPIDDFLIPAVQNAMTHHPLIAIAGGALFGAAFGSLKSSDINGERVVGRYGKIVGAAIGASVMGGAVLYKMLNEAINGKAWVPERRKKERDVEEYFDVLAYVKNDALFNKYANEALRKEGFNVEAFVTSKEIEGDMRKNRMRDLEAIKRQFYTAKPGMWDGLLDRLREEFGIDAPDRQAAMTAINAEINQLRTHRELRPVTPLAAKALQYHQARKATMYGYESGDPIANVLSALPKKDKDYLIPFIQAPEEERDRILDIVPNYMKRVLQSAWGMDADSKPSLRKYFGDKPLPGAGWAGWREDVSLKDIKVKFVDQVGLDPSEFDIWPADVQRADQVNARTPDIFSGKESEASFSRKIHDILSGSGLDGVTLEMIDSDVAGVQLDLQIERNREQEFKKLLNDEGGNVM